jgi:hypothetical protein
MGKSRTETETKELKENIRKMKLKEGKYYPFRQNLKVHRKKLI